MVEYNELPEIDKWAIMKINELVKTVTEGYDIYQFNKAYYGINSFLVHDMSTFYLDIIKDRLYVEGKTSKERRSAQTAMYIILSKLVRILAPITAFTAEEIWKYMPKKENENTFSIMLEDYPKYDEKLYDKKLDDKFKKIIEIKELVSKKLEEAREEKLIGQTLEAKVTVSANKENELYEIIKNNKNLIEDVLIVSELELKEDNSKEKEELSVNISRAEGEKCERCWKYTKDVGIDKENLTICKRCSEVLRKYAKDYEI
jgi:isoleucine--tRNA ligase